MVGVFWFLGKLTQGENICISCENLVKICPWDLHHHTDGLPRGEGCNFLLCIKGWPWLKTKIGLKEPISDKGIPLLELSCQKKRWEEIQGSTALKLLAITYGFIWILSLRYYSIKQPPSNPPLRCGLLDDRQCLSLDSSPGTEKKGLCKSAAWKNRKDKQGNVN